LLASRDLRPLATRSPSVLILVQVGEAPSWLTTKQESSPERLTGLTRRSPRPTLGVGRRSQIVRTKLFSVCRAKSTLKKTSVRLTYDLRTTLRKFPGSRILRSYVLRNIQDAHGMAVPPPVFSAHPRSSGTPSGIHQRPCSSTPLDKLSSGPTVSLHATVKRRAERMSRACQVLLRLILSPPSLRHFVTQGLLPSVAVLRCGFSLPVGGFMRTFD